MFDLIRRAIADIADENAQRPLREDTFHFGGLSVCLRTRGAGWTDAVLHSIGHRRVDASPAAFVIDVLGGLQRRLEHLLPPRDRRGERFQHEDERACMFWAAEGNLTLLDRHARRGVVWYVAPDAIPSWEVGRPFLPLIKALTVSTAWTPVHAAAVARDGAGVLILGSSNAGKSSTALACVDAGWRYVGDDCVLLTSELPRAANLFRTARVRADMVPMLKTAMTATERFSTDSGEVRAEIDVSRFTGADIGDADLRAIVLPERNGADRAHAAPLSRGRALRALSATTMVMLPGAPAATYRILADVVQRLPCYIVDPGPELAAVPAILAQLVERLPCA